MADERCTFCDIISGRRPGKIRYEDDEIVAFDNRLDWVPVMLLLAPRRHMTQVQLWRSGGLAAHIASVAVDLGQEYSPGGFRVLANFGHDALQTQPHGHLHVLGGTYLGLYVGQGG